MMRRLALCALLLLAARAAWATDDMRDPFAFPQSGVTHTARFECGVASSGGRYTVDSTGTGTSGVLRGITIINTTVDSTAVGQFWLTLTYDGAAAATDSFPVSGLIGFDNARNSMVDSTHTFATPFWERRLAWTSPRGTNGIHWRLQFPIPYTNGYVVRLYNWTSSTAALWVEATRQVGLPSCWNRTYRFHVSRTDSTLVAGVNVPGSGTRKVWFSKAGQGHGSNTAVKSQHVGWAFVGVAGAGATPWNKELVLVGQTADTLFTAGATDLDAINSLGQKTSPTFTRPEVFFRRPAGKVGYIAQTILALTSTDNTQLEACQRFYLVSPNAGSDGALPDFISTGTEDYFGGAGYGFAGVNGDKALPSPTAGATSYTTSLDWGTGAVGTYYRVFRSDPLAYTNGCSGTYTNWLTVTIRCIWTTVYYERQ